MSSRIIVVPIDGSQFSRQMVPHLCQICTPERDAMVLLRVGEPSGSLIGSPPRLVSLSWTTPMYDSPRDIEYNAHPIYATQIEQNERSELELELEPERQVLEQAGFNVRVEARFGDPAEEIVALAEQLHADMIAMATHGRTGLRQLLMGSVAEQVLRRVDIPVLMLRSFRTSNRAN